MVALSQIRCISTDEMIQSVDSKTHTIIDVRSVEAYNGWKLTNEKRAGHIPTAKSLPLKWASYIDWIEIVRSKDIQPTHSLILYGSDAAETKKLAHQFQQAGFADVSVYHDFLNEWAADSHLPLQQLKRYRHLVSADWLNQLITTGKAPEYQNTEYVLCHAHYQNKDAYEQGHIPEAVDLDTNLLESKETWNRRSADELTNAFEQLGITSDTTVILYGRFSHPNNQDPFPGSSAGHLGAMRCAFIMLYAGVKDVRILNGGLQSWIDSGYQPTTKEYAPQSVQDFGTTIPAHPNLAVDLDEAEEILQHPQKNLVSVRSWREYIGEVSGYHYISKKGRIPGSVFGNCGTDAYHMQNYRNLDHTTREYHEIEQMWRKVGITSDKHNSFYCGTGWRGSEAFINAWLMGWNDISVFDGGWFEWSNNNNAFETGIPSEKQQQILRV